jgi:hypothetical protein
MEGRHGRKQRRAAGNINELVVVVSVNGRMSTLCRAHGNNQKKNSQYFPMDGEWNRAEGVLRAAISASVRGAKVKPRVGGICGESFRKRIWEGAEGRQKESRLELSRWTEIGNFAVGYHHAG